MKRVLENAKKKYKTTHVIEIIELRDTTDDNIMYLELALALDYNVICT